MTDARETPTRNLYACYTDLQQDFSIASFSHQIDRVLSYARISQSRDSIHARWLDIRVCFKMWPASG